MSGQWHCWRCEEVISPKDIYFLGQDPDRRCCFKCLKEIISDDFAKYFKDRGSPRIDMEVEK